jgi:alkylation response protein AidB-like acyl-CoA dehydrogenase
MSSSDTLDRPAVRRDPVEWAEELGQKIAADAARHDREGSFVTEAYDLLKAEGYLALAVPEELGGHGATIREVAMAQRALARHCSATALASVMHHHVVLFTAWRHRRGLPGAEATLRRVAEEGIVLVSTGGADTTRPRGEAVPTEGGYLLSGRKIFVSQSPAGDVMSTMFAFDDPEQGRRVLNLAVPLSAEGVTIHETWDALGMRGTGSHEVELDQVFVPEEKVLANRPHGKVDGPLQVIFSNALLPIAAVYLGVAEAARNAAVASVEGTAKVDDPTIRRSIGLMDTRLRVAGWALDGALDVVGDDPEPSMDTVVAVMAAKREISLAGLEVCNLALDVVGGPGFTKGTVVERAYRDIRGASFHPFGNEETLLHAGAVALGLPADDR